MGAWGIGTFDNDDAADWLFDLEASSDISVVSAALQLDGDYIEAPDASAALAAVEIILALMGKPRDGLPDEAGAWVAKHGALDANSLRQPAITALDVIMSEKSELRELWFESDEGDAWLADVTEMRGLLAVENQ